MDEKAKEKEAEWVQKKVDELSDALKKTVKAIRDYDIPVVEEAHYDERGLARDEWSPIRYYRVGKYDVDCRRIWKPSEGRGKRAEDWLRVRVYAPYRSRSPDLSIGTDIINGKVQEYVFGVFPNTDTKYDKIAISFDAKGKANSVISGLKNEKLWNVRCKTIPQSYIPKFQKPKGEIRGGEYVHLAR
jgi:hypothetical protein